MSSKEDAAHVLGHAAGLALLRCGAEEDRPQLGQPSFPVAEGVHIGDVQLYVVVGEHVVEWQSDNG